MSLRDAVVAVDVGTSAVRAALVSATGAVLRSERVARTSHVGGETFDADALLTDVEAALSRLDAVTDARVHALGISAHIGTVAVDEDFAVVAPGGGWADGRGSDVPIADDLLRDILTVAGRPVPTGGALALGLHLQRAGAASQVAALLSPKDFLLARLCGVTVTDTVDAAYTLASQVRTSTWNTAALRRLGLPEQWWPRQASPCEVVATLLPAAADRCGLPHDLPVVAGGPDGSVGLGLLLGASTDVIGDVAGTTDVLARLISSVDDAPLGAVVNPAMVPGLWTAGGPTGLTGGAVADWRTLVGSVEDDVLAAVEPGVGGLVILPCMTGERFPRWRPGSRGAIIGRTSEHGAAALLRATQEGAAFTVREGLDLLDPSRDLPVVFAGGSSRAESVVQLRADVFGRRLLVASDPDVTLLGAAALAMIGAGVSDSLDEARATLGVSFREVEPRPGVGPRFDAAYAHWRAVRERLAG
ncbi:FGGY-family carbohydrate kinase [Microbacterium sp. BH-3-3-3]|uniref:xylulokinase n=1 Tax=Microbacterium sp. BH-3-3-3 TaxID=1906742 RepID=UPI00119E0A90|nr:FGGY-family carbohydrate kinase [Microbacterium sp. BH-3-3-3]